MQRARVLVLLIAWSSAARAQSIVGVRDSSSIQVDAIFSAYNRTDAPGCAVGVYRDGRIVYARGYGMANLELGVPITPRTVFDIGSVSKMFTASAVVLLAEDGRLSLEDPIDRVFPEMPPYASGITIRQLLNHTAGLHEYYNLLRLVGIGPGAGNASTWTRMLVRSTTTNFPPGTRAEYSNSAYVLAGELVSRLSGRSLADFLQQRVFGPLGMADTHLFDDHRLLTPGRAQSYDAAPSGGFRTAFSLLDSGGDGGVWTSVEDFARWDANWDSGTVGGRALGDSLVVQAKLSDGATHRYALGGSLEIVNGLRTYTKDGNAAGFTATYRRYLKPKLAIATLCNRDADTDPLTRQVAAVYLRAELIPDKPTAPDPWATALLAAPEAVVPVAQLRRLEGWWRNEASGETHSFRVEGDGLLINERGRLLSLGADRFRGRGATAVELAFDSSGLSGPERLRIRDLNGVRTLERKGLARPTGRELANYVGDYRSDELETMYTLVADSVGLEVRIGTRWLGRLEPTWRDAFLLVTRPVPSSALPEVPGSRLGDRTYSFEFARDVRNRIVGFAIQGQAGRGIRNVPFVRRP